MKDPSKTKQELLIETATLKQRNQELEESEKIRMQAEAALRESEAKWKEIFETIEDLYYEVDSEGVIKLLSPSVHRLTGWNEEDLIGKPVSTVYADPHDREQLLSKLSEKGYIHDYELVLKKKDGEKQQVSLSARTIVDDNGRPIGVRGLLRDITERKQAGEALQESEEKYRNIFENAIEGIFQSTPDDRYISVNPAFARMFGFESPRDMIEGITNIAEQIYNNPEDIKKLKENLDSQGTVKGFETQAYRKDGDKIWVSVNARAVRDAHGSVLRYEGGAEDITKRKQIEEELRRSDAMYRTIFDNTGTAMIIIDEHTIIVLCNGEWVKLSGYSREENEGKKSWTEFVHEEDLKAMQKYHTKRRVDYTDAPRQYEFRFIDRHGNIHNMINTVAMIPGTKMSVAAQLDITDLKYAETEKSRLQSQLLQLQKMEAIGTLAGGIAHDFNNILMSIQGYASLILSETANNHPHYESLKLIEEQAINAAGLTRQLLGFARGGKYEVKPVNINDLIEKTSTMFGRTKKEIAIHRKYEKDIWIVEADLSQIEQVFLNLYLNAWQAMPAGGDLSLETRNIVADEAYAKTYSMAPGRYVRISVSDTGLGMDEKTKERIFEPFFTTKELGKGTGLGLAMVYGIVRNHDGFIYVISKPGKGTAFVIHFPASDKNVVKEKPAVLNIKKGTETILVVDDEPSVLAVSKVILESLGYKVYGVRNGAEAIALYREKQNEVDLIVLDMIMPGLSGGETFDQIRELNPAVKTILSSGYSLDGQAQQIMNKGCRGFIQKPFKITHLSRKIREVLDQ